MTSTVTPITAPEPTIWGLDPLRLHDHYWAARGVCVIRPGTDAPIPPGAELFMLTDARIFALFKLRGLVETLSWVKPAVLFVRLRGGDKQAYREVVVTDDDAFVRFERRYGSAMPRLTRVAFTRDPEIVRFWQNCTDSQAAWRQLRRQSRLMKRETCTVSGYAYDRSEADDVSRFTTDLVRFWKHPSATIPQLKQIAPSVWAHSDVQVEPGVRFVGPVWIGAGRSTAGNQSVLGPAALWDHPTSKPEAGGPDWLEIEPMAPTGNMIRIKRPSHRRGQRIFDLVFSLIALLITLPLYPIVMLAIWLEDGRPFFFTHRRETVGGRSFPCLKFRSMRKDAEQMKAQLNAINQADGPQFFLEDDPRLTRVGRIIRKLNIDEFPQFLNVLFGQMSIVGPRPSPYKENQYCPGWREARLSVRPGITGLWQVSRTRQAGADFQEWIKYDLQYVQMASIKLDLIIVWRTLRILTGL